MPQIVSLREPRKRICKTVGYPKTIRVDQGSKFVSRDLDIWAYQKDVVLDFSRSGKPTDNSFIESFNGKFRSECLDGEHDHRWTVRLGHARQRATTSTFRQAHIEGYC